MAVLINGANGLLRAYDYQVPTTGFSYTFASGTQVLVMNPAGTLATGTITMPTNPSDGMTITFSSTQTITALTLSGNTGQTIVSAPTTLPANQAATYIYRLASTNWLPVTYVPQLIGGSGLATAVLPIGYNQTWQNLIGSRAYGTTYTNSTGRPIMVCVSTLNGGSVTSSYIVVDGVTIMIGGAMSNRREWFSFIVPNGSTYSVQGNESLDGWTELR